MNENLRNSSCHVWKHKSVFLQILYQSLVSWNITSLYFFSSKITYFGQKQSIKVQMFEIFEPSVKIRQIPYVSFELTSQFLFNFVSFIIPTTHNSFADFKLIHFLLWLKGFHQSLKDFPVLWWKFVKSYISFLKAQVSFPSDFESILSAVKHNSSVLF